MVKISIIMPIYNVENYLKETLESVINQSFKDFELIAIDDGSTDSSFNILSKFAVDDLRIKVFKQTNSGPSLARNSGLKKARGEYIVFMDSDDILPEKSLEIRYNAITKFQADVVVGATNKFNSKEEWKMKRHYLEEGYKSIYKNFELLRNLGPCNKIYKKELLSNIVFKEDIDYAEDVMFVMEALIKSSKIYTVSDLVYKYRERENSLTDVSKRSSIILKQAIDSLFCVNEIIDNYCDSKESIEILKKEYFERVIDVDIWKPCKMILDSNNKTEVQNGISYIENLVSNTEKSVIDSSDKLRFFLAKTIYEFYDVYLGNKENLDRVLNIYCENNACCSKEYKRFTKMIKGFLRKSNKSKLLIYLARVKLFS